jgi:hypothetical protein
MVLGLCPAARRWTVHDVTSLSPSSCSDGVRRATETSYRRAVAQKRRLDQGKRKRFARWEGFEPPTF